MEKEEDFLFSPLLFDVGFDVGCENPFKPMLLFSWPLLLPFVLPFGEGLSVRLYLFSSSSVYNSMVPSLYSAEYFFSATL